MSLPANVRPVKDRHGKVRYRFRKKGLPSAYVQGMPGSALFTQSYRMCLAGEKQPDVSERRRHRSEIEARAARQRIQSFYGQIVVYFVTFDNKSVKIGTTTNLQDRFKKLQNGAPQELHLMASTPGGRKAEAEYHLRFRDAHIRGEWFRLTTCLRNEIERLRGQENVHDVDPF